jgi:hypothetical protein
MKKPSVRIVVPDVPLNVEGCPAEAQTVGLGQIPKNGEYRLFLFLAPPDAPPDAPERYDVVHLSVDNGRFLRDAIDKVLEQYQAITRNSN